jgi:hypothetical protein
MTRTWAAPIASTSTQRSPLHLCRGGVGRVDRESGCLGQRVFRFVSDGRLLRLDAEHPLQESRRAGVEVEAKEGSSSTQAPQNGMGMAFDIRMYIASVEVPMV